MKLHLPISLFRALLTGFVAGVTTVTSLAYAINSEEEDEHLMLLIEEYPNGSITYTSGQTTSSMMLHGYESVLFIKNSGGAISNIGTCTLSGNGTVDFSGNDNRRANSGGGAIRSSWGTFILSNNEDVTFNENLASYLGGAIYNNGSSFILRDNGDIAFSGNMVSTTNPIAYGGAIYNGGSGASFILSNNGDVLFEKNAEITNGGYRLRSIYSKEMLKISSSSGHSIAFHDSLYARGNTDFNYEGAGDIVFTGAYTETDLLNMKGSHGTMSEVQKSQISQFLSKVTLGAGTMHVEEGAKLLFKELLLGSVDQMASLSLQNGWVESSCPLHLSNKSTIICSGVNYLLSSEVIAEGNNVLLITLGPENLQHSSLSISGALREPENLVVDLGDVSGLNAKNYRVLHVMGNDDGWKDIKIQLTGGAINELVWVDGTLYYRYDSSMLFEQPSLETIIEERLTVDSLAVFEGYKTITTEGNGVGISNYGYTVIMDNDAVSFSGIVDTAIGNYNDSFFSLSANETVSFRGNLRRPIYSQNATFTLSNNREVWFSENLGGCIDNNHDGIFTLLDNGKVTFNANTQNDGAGGAICHQGAFSLCGNDNVIFSGNKAACTSSYAYGGAISSSGYFDLCNNTLVRFFHNAVVSSSSYSAQGGAIYNTGTFTLSGNGDVLFEKNAEVSKGIYRLRSIYSTATLNLSALEGKSILFRDSLYAKGTVNLNQDGAGDIIFTGATTEADLREVKGGVVGTAEEILNSRTSEIATMTNLYGGRLIVEDGAILEGRGITAVADSGATVRVNNGTIAQRGYELTFDKGTTLEAAGVSSITATSVNMKADSTLSFVLGAENCATSVLTLTGSLHLESGVRITLDCDSSLGSGTYKLLTLTSSVGYSSININLSDDDLMELSEAYWRNGTFWITLQAASGWISSSIYQLAGKDTTTTSDIHGVSHMATIQQMSGTLIVDDTALVATSGGNITLKSGTLSGTISNAVVTVQGGSLKASFGGSNTLNGSNYTLDSVIANSGTLVMSGQFNASALTLNTTAATHVDVNGNSGASGFAKDAVYSVKLVNGGTVVNSGATVTHGTRTLELGSDGYATAGGAVDYATYLLTGTATASTGAIHAKAAGAAVSMSGGTLTVNDAATVNATGGTVVLSSGTLDGSLNDVTVNAAGGTLAADMRGGKLAVNGNVNLAGYAHTSIELNSGRLTAAETLELENGQSLSFKGGRLTGDVLTGTGSTLTLGSNATLNGDLTLDGGQLALNGNTLAVAGALNLVSTTSVDISSYAIGTYKLLTFGALEGRLDNLVLSGSRYRTSVSEENGALTLTVLNNNLTWSQPKGTWSNLGAFGTGVFRADDDVNFRSAANVTISGTVTPGSVLVNTPGNVVLVADKKVYGSGISGEGSVTKSGAGMLTMNAGNTYSGGTTLNAGTLKATAVDSFGTGAITVNGGTLDLGSKAVANDIILSGTATLKGDAKYAGNVSVDGNATLLARTSYKGMTTIGSGSSLTLAEKVTMAGNLVVDGALRIRDAKGLTLVKNQTLTLDNGGAVRGLLTVGTGSTLVWADGSFETAAPVLKGGTLDLGAEHALTLTGTKALVQFGDKVVDLPGKGIVYTDETLTVNGGTVTINTVAGYEGELVVNEGTLKLSTGKVPTANAIVVSGNAAVVNGATHSGDITVDGVLAKGTTIKLRTGDQRVTLNGSGVMLGSISGAGVVDVRGDVDITGAKLTNANILLGGTLTHAKGLTLVKGQTLTLDGGSVNGMLTIGAGAVLDMNGHTLASAPVLKGGTYDDGGSNTLTLTGSKADISLGGQQISLLSKSFIRSDAALTVSSGTVTVNDFGASNQEVTVTGGTLKLATGKLTSRNAIVVNGTAAVVNGATHEGDIEVNGLLDKGTTIKLLTATQRVSLNGEGALLGTIAGTGIVDVNASIDATAARITAARLNLNSGLYTNTKGLAVAKGQTLTLAGAALNLGPKGTLTTAVGSTLVVSSATTLTGNLTFGGGELVFAGGTLDVSGTLTLSKPMTVTDGGVITYGTLKPFRGDIAALFGGADVELDEESCTITFNGGVAVRSRLAPAPLDTTAAPVTAETVEETTHAPAALDTTPVLPPAPVTNPVADAMVQADWGILDAERAFMGAVNNRSQHATLLNKGRGAAWVSAFGASVRHGNQGMHHGSDGNIEGAAFGLEHAVSDTGTLGLAVGRSKNRLAATGVTHLRQETAHVALYGQKHLAHGFTADAAAAYGDTETKLGAASWQQKSAALTARLTHAQQVPDATVLAFRTFGGLAYEATDAGSIGSAHTGSVQNLRAELGAGITHTAGKAHLYAEAALTGDLIRHNPTADLDSTRTHGANPGRIGLRATVGGIYEFTDTWSGTASYGIEAESRSTSHTLNVGVSKSF